MIGKVVTGCVAILPYHTATQDRGSECRDFGFISPIVTALMFNACSPLETLMDKVSLSLLCTWLANISQASLI